MLQTITTIYHDLFNHIICYMLCCYVCASHIPPHIATASSATMLGQSVPKGRDNLTSISVPARSLHCANTAEPQQLQRPNAVGA